MNLHSFVSIESLKVNVQTWYLGSVWICLVIGYSLLFFKRKWAQRYQDKHRSRLLDTYESRAEVILREKLTLLKVSSLLCEGCHVRADT